MAFKLFTLLLLAVEALSLAVPASHEIHEKRGALNQRWTKRSRISARSILPVRIGLAQNLEGAEAHLMDVSDPHSPNFGKYWTPEQIVETFKPSEDTVATVREWLTSSGIAPSRIVHSDNKAWLAFDAFGEEAERLLHTEFYEHEDSISESRMPACDQYHLPSYIRKHVDYVTPGIRLTAPSSAGSTKLRKRSISGSTHKKRSAQAGLRRPTLKTVAPGYVLAGNSSDLSTCDEAITPACLAALYKIPPTDKSQKPVASNVMGIYESDLQFWDQLSLNLFFRNFTPYIPQGTHPSLKSIDGGIAQTTNVSMDGGEVELDLQLAYPIVYPQTITIWDEDDIPYQTIESNTYNSGFNTFLDAIDGSYCTYSAFGETGDSPLDPR